MSTVESHGFGEAAQQQGCAVRLAVLEALLAWHEAGRGGDPEPELLRRFPGYERVVREELEALGSEAAAPAGQRRIGGYTLLRPLALGGQGVVWLARDDKLGRDVAFKMVPLATLGDDSALARFRSEAALAARLDHPGICPVFDAGIADGMAWIAMRHVAGETLASHFAKRRGRAATPTERDELLRLLHDLLRALSVAHDAGIVHRDIKPPNVIVTPRGAPVILDFGLAKDAGSLGPTLTGDSLGTPGYASPEQVRGEPVDARSDVFAVGVVLFEGLCGVRPFDAPTRAAVEQAVLTREPRFRDLPRDLAAVLETALSKDPERRYVGAADFADDLKCFQEHRAVSVHCSGPIQQTLRWLRREPVLALTATLVLAVSSVATWVATRARWAAEEAAVHANATALAAEAEHLAASRPDLALALARRAFVAHPSRRTRGALVSVLDRATAVSIGRGDLFAGRSGLWLPEAGWLVQQRPDGVLVRQPGAESHRFLPMTSEPQCLAAAESLGGAVIGVADGSVWALKFDEEFGLQRVVEPDGAAVTALHADAGGALMIGTSDGRVRWLGSDGAARRELYFGAPADQVCGGLAGGASAIFLRSGDYLLRGPDGEARRHWRMAGTGFYPVLAVDDGRHLVTASHDDEQRGVLRIDGVLDDSVALVPLFDELVASLSTEPDGARVLAGDLHGNLAVVDVREQSVTRLGGVDARLTAGWVPPASNEYLAGLSSGTVLVGRGERSGRVALRGSAFGVDLVTPIDLSRFGLGSGPGVLTWSPLGELIVHRLRPLPDPLGPHRALFATGASLAQRAELLAVVSPAGVGVSSIGEPGVPDERRVDWWQPIESARVWNVRFSPDEETLAVCEVDGGVRFFSVRTGEELRRLPSDRKSLAAAWTSCGDRFLVAGVDDRLTVFRPDRDSVESVQLPVGAVQVLLRWSSERLVALGYNGTLMEIDHRNESIRVAVLANEVNQVATDPSRGRLVWSTGNEVVLKEGAAGAPVRERLLSENRVQTVISALGLLPDGQRLVLGDRDGSLWMINIANGEKRSFGRHGAPIYRFVWTQTGDRIASAARDGSLMIHDGAGDLVVELPPCPPFPMSMQFDAGNRLLVVGGSAQRVSLWPTNDAALLDLADRGAVASLDARALDRWRDLLDGTSPSPQDAFDRVAEPPTGPARR